MKQNDSPLNRFSRFTNPISNAIVVGLLFMVMGFTIIPMGLMWISDAVHSRLSAEEREAMEHSFIISITEVYKPQFLPWTISLMILSGVFGGFYGHISGRSKKNLALLVSERALLTTLMKNSEDNIYFKDIDGRFIRISDSQAKLLNLSDPAMAVGKSDFDFFSEAHARQAFEDEQQIIKTNSPLIGHQEHLTLSGKPDMWVSTTKLPIQDEDGIISGTFGITRDITQSKLAEQELAESNSLRELLLDIITHDLKNPASVIYSMSEMARTELPDNEIIDSIYVSSERLLAVLTNTTILSQAAFGEEIPKESMALDGLLQEIRVDFSSIVGNSRNEIRIRPTTRCYYQCQPINWGGF